MPTFADVNWETILGSGAAALATVGGGAAAAVRFLLGHLRERAAEQRGHETAMMLRMEAITAKFDATVREAQQTQRADSRETITTLLGIQRETVEAVAALGTRVGELGAAIQELRREVAGKQDREQWNEPKKRGTRGDGTA